MVSFSVVEIYNSKRRADRMLGCERIDCVILYFSYSSLVLPHEDEGIKSITITITLASDDGQLIVKSQINGQIFAASVICSVSLPTKLVLFEYWCYENAEHSSEILGASCFL